MGSCWRRSCWRSGPGKRCGADGNITLKGLDGNITFEYSDGNKTIRKLIMPARGEVKSTEALGHLLQQGRLVAGLTQRQMAEMLDTDQKYIWSLESGKESIILDRIFAIMRETGLRMYIEIDQPRDSAHG